MNEDELIRQRLLVDERPLKRILKEFTAAVEGNGESAGLEKELTLYQQQIVKWQLVREMNDREVEHFNEECQRIENEILQSKAAIEALRASIEAEKKRKKNEEEYENLARVILQHPSRQDSSGKLAEIEAKIGASEAEKAKLDRLIDLRGKQFYAFLSAAQELRQLLKEEEEERALALQEANPQDEEMKGTPTKEEGESEEGEQKMDTS